MFERIRQALIVLLGIALCGFTLVEVNFPHLQVLSTRAVFVMLGMVLCFLAYPISQRFKDVKALRFLDSLLILATIVCCGFVFVQSEPWLERFWIDGKSFGNRAGAESTTDFVIGLLGIGLVLEVTRRAIGWIVPALALLFILHSYYCYLSAEHGLPMLPAWMLPNSGQGLKQIAGTAFSQQGVFGIATDVMFRYVFLFVVFGSFLELSGATQFIIDFSERVFGRSAGGPAKVSVLGSGLMGSLSGSAVANAVTTGSFTIPMMRNAGFSPAAAGGITAAAATGGALVPPVMGAGAYMMLELVEPQVSFLQIAKAAVIPSILYYLSLWLIVHFYSKRVGAAAVVENKKATRIDVFDGTVFLAALVVLIGLLAMRFTPFKAVTGSLVVILLLTALRSRLANGDTLTIGTRLLSLAMFAVGSLGYLGYLARFTDEFDEIHSGWNVFEAGLDASFVGMFLMIAFGVLLSLLSKLPAFSPEAGGSKGSLAGWQSVVGALSKSSKNGIALVAASACVGIIIGVVTQSGIAADFSREIKGVVEQSLLLALVGIMVCSIILGMGVPSVVCYLLMATLMGSLLQDLGVIPLGAHLFIFYFGMMSMVTPPVALAAYASASIAGAKIMTTATAAFRFALVGFTLPYMFIYRPALLLLNDQRWKDWLTAPDSADRQALLQTAENAWPELSNLAVALVAAIIGITILAAGIAGYLRAPLSRLLRGLAFLSAALLLLPEINVSGRDVGVWVNLVGAALFVGILMANKKSPADTMAKPATT